VIEVTLAGGQVSGVEPRVEVAAGSQVVLRVTSDIAEEIHVHGYDLYADLVPGSPAQLAFKADLPGAYEVELHQAGRPLFQLRVA
jgi:heme/copper-type cytochrome/quinol oxidase subunit 2